MLFMSVDTKWNKIIIGKFLCKSGIKAKGSKCFSIIMVREHDNASHLSVEMILIILLANTMEHLCAKYYCKHFT